MIQLDEQIDFRDSVCDPPRYQKTSTPPTSTPPPDVQFHFPQTTHPTMMTPFDLRSIGLPVLLAAVAIAALSAQATAATDVDVCKNVCYGTIFLGTESTEADATECCEHTIPNQAGGGITIDGDLTGDSACTSCGDGSYAIVCYGGDGTNDIKKSGSQCDDASTGVDSSAGHTSTSVEWLFVAGLMTTAVFML